MKKIPRNNFMFVVENFAREKLCQDFSRNLVVNYILYFSSYGV